MQDRLNIFKNKEYLIYNKIIAIEYITNFIETVINYNNYFPADEINLSELLEKIKIDFPDCDSSKVIYIDEISHPSASKLYKYIIYLKNQGYDKINKTVRTKSFLETISIFGKPQSKKSIEIIYEKMKLFYTNLVNLYYESLYGLSSKLAEQIKPFHNCNLVFIDLQIKQDRPLIMGMYFFEERNKKIGSPVKVFFSKNKKSRFLKRNNLHILEENFDWEKDYLYMNKLFKLKKYSQGLIPLFFHEKLFISKGIREFLERSIKEYATKNK